MTLNFHILELEAYDDLASIRDRIAFLRGDRVLLVWPGAGELLTRKLDLVLLQRAAARNGLRLAVVTDDPDVRDNAADLHISAFPTVGAARRSRWQQPRRQVFARRGSRSLAAEDDRRRGTIAARRRATASRSVNSPRAIAVRRVGRLAAITVLLVAVALIGFGVLPSANVTLFPARDQVTTTIQLIADPQVTILHVDGNRIPAQLDTSHVIQRQVALPSSGTRGVPASRATGTVLLTNTTTAPVLVPKGTVVQTLAANNPAQFGITADTLIDAKGSATVPIAALDSSSGTAGNIDAGLIAQIGSGLGGSITVRNPDATTGGTLREEKFVTDADRQQLLKLGRAQILATVSSDFALSPTQFIVPGSVAIVEERPEWTTYSAFVGDAAETLTLTLKVRIQALIVDELAARQVAAARLSAQLGNRTLVLPSVAYRRGAIGALQPDQTVSFTITASANAISPIDADQVRSQISGLSIDQALATLNRSWLLDPTRPPQIGVFPALFGRLPFLSVRITVEVVP